MGHSRDPERRLSHYNTGCPNREFKLEGYLYFKNRKIAERNVHYLLEDQGFHRKGEWFDCSAKYVIDMLGTIDDQEAYSRYRNKRFSSKPSVDDWNERPSDTKQEGVLVPF